MSLFLCVAHLKKLVGMEIQQDTGSSEKFPEIEITERMSTWAPGRPSYGRLVLVRNIKVHESQKINLVEVSVLNKQDYTS